MLGPTTAAASSCYCPSDQIVKTTISSRVDLIGSNLLLSNLCLIFERENREREREREGEPSPWLDEPDVPAMVESGRRWQRVGEVVAVFPVTTALNLDR